MAPTLLLLPIERTNAATSTTRRALYAGGEMGYRVFRDSHGNEWQTWDVVPRVGERRRSERRSRVMIPVAVDRRSARDRRMLAGPRPLLRSGFDAGWLCFEARHEKRRLSPIPADWQRCPEHELEHYCGQATPVRRVSSEFQSIDPAL